MGEPKRTRIQFVGFEQVAQTEAALAALLDARERRSIVVEDWVMLHKEHGKVTMANDKSADPGPARGAAVGGVLGGVLAVISGPIGIAAVAGGAAIGAITAAVKDSGLKNDDIDTVARFMQDGRSGLMIAIPLAEADKWEPFVAANAAIFDAAVKRHQVDIVPGRTFEQAVQEYVAQEEA
jgi:uncharacterized membrane protein